MSKPSPRVLVVDDVPLLRRFVSSHLRKLGIEQIAEAAGGTEALQALRAAPVDLVISDWNMPSMSGIELLRAMRADEALKGIPFLLVTASVESAEIEEAVQAGANGYLRKPFDAGALDAELRRIGVARSV